MDGYHEKRECYVDAYHMLCEECALRMSVTRRDWMNIMKRVDAMWMS